MTSWPVAVALGSATLSAASPAVEITFAVVDGDVVLARRPGVNAPKLAGVPSVSASVAGTVPPTSPSADAQIAVASCVGSLSDVAVSVTGRRGARAPCRRRPAPGPSRRTSPWRARSCRCACPAGAARRGRRGGRRRCRGTPRRPAGGRRVGRRRRARVGQRERAGGEARRSVPRGGAAERDAARLRAGAVERLHGDRVVQDAVGVGALVDDVEVQAVRPSSSYSYERARVQARVERRVVELALVADRGFCRRAVGLDEVDLVDVLRVRVDDPDEAARTCRRTSSRVLVLEIRTPWPGSKESEPICWTTSIV